ncbi:ankyrin repeat-containing protein BDA1-like [Alnus glutinosa]|uniref:ankyrin repeat-containing protein BDA1-like n=1 Tax=Alnus glutinosa TaxID=3517 RepID=UPI002D771094|nr:ankyrin repeat-containing protein BDA1-like [Alnus glutinosa]
MDPRLVKAALNGNTIELQKLLQEDSLLLERDSVALYPETALHIATMGGQTQFVRELLKLKPDFATRLNKDGFSAIHIASANGFVETVRELLKFSRELAHLKSSDGKTSLHCAAVTGRVRVIEEVIGFSPDCIGDVTQRGETVLHLAVKYNQFEAFKAMVDLSKQLNIKDILNAGDEDGNTVLHLAIARKQSQTVKLLLGGDGSQQEAVSANVTNKSGFTALDVSDVIQQMVGEPTDFIIRDLLLRAGALRGSEVEDEETTQVHHRQILVTTLPPQTLWQFLLHDISLLNPCRFWEMLAKEVKRSTSQTQNALLVVAVLIATITYQAILNPPNGIYYGSDYTAANISADLQEFIPFMVPNSIGFFASLAVIILVMDEFPLKALLGIAVRCMAASYVCGLLLIGPSGLNASRWAMTIIGMMVLMDLLRFGYWLVKRWSTEIRNRRIQRQRTFRVVSLANGAVASTGQESREHA